MADVNAQADERPDVVGEFAARTLQGRLDRADVLRAEGACDRAADIYAGVLRVAPDIVEARQGLVECLKLRSGLYRGLVATRKGIESVLSVLPGDGKRSRGWAAGIVATGIALGMKLSRQGPEFASPIWAVCGLPALVLLGALLIDSVATLQAWRSVHWREARSDGYGTSAAFTFGCLVSAIIAAGLYAFVGHIGALALAMMFFVLAVFCGKALRVRGSRAQMLAGIYVGLTAAVGIAAVVIATANMDGADMNERLPGASGVLLLLFILLALFAGWACRLCGDWFGPPMQYVDPMAKATDPGGFRLSDARLRRLNPELYGWRAVVFGLLFAGPGVSGRRIREALAEHLLQGDSRAAVVISTRPLLVAAYSDDLDCVAILRFDADVPPRHGLRRGSRVVTVNTYSTDPADGADLDYGPDWNRAWTGFWPVIADFVSDDISRIEQRKRAIPEAEWEKAFRYGREYLVRRPHQARDGSPATAGTPATVP